VNKKTTFSVLITLALLLGLAACGTSAATEDTPVPEQTIAEKALAESIKPAAAEPVVSKETTVTDKEITITVETAQGTKTELDFSVWKDEPVIPGPFPLSGGPGTGVTDAVGIFLCLSAFLGLTIGNRPGRNRRKEAARR